MARIMINSVPKAGTHLLAKVLSELGCAESRYLLRRSFFPQQCLCDEGGAPIGVDAPVMIASGCIESLLERIDSGTFVKAHIPHSGMMQHLLEGLQYKIVTILRDPRDVAVSHLFHILKLKEHFMHRVYSGLAFDEQLKLSIAGYQPDGEGEVGLKSLPERYRSVLEWDAMPRNLFVRFEDLVGAAGGGEASRQLAALQRIAFFWTWMPMSPASKLPVMPFSGGR